MWWTLNLTLHLVKVLIYMFPSPRYCCSPSLCGCIDLDHIPGKHNKPILKGVLLYLCLQERTWLYKCRSIIRDNTPTERLKQKRWTIWRWSMSYIGYLRPNKPKFIESKLRLGEWCAYAASGLGGDVRYWETGLLHKDWTDTKSHVLGDTWLCDLGLRIGGSW